MVTYGGTKYGTRYSAMFDTISGTIFNTIYTSSNIEGLRADTLMGSGGRGMPPYTEQKYIDILIIIVVVIS